MVLKSVNDANKINKHIEDRIKAYAQSKDEADATIVIGGGGLTGVELVGEIVDNFRKSAQNMVLILLILKLNLLKLVRKSCQFFQIHLSNALLKA